MPLCSWSYLRDQFYYPDWSLTRVRDDSTDTPFHPRKMKAIAIEQVTRELMEGHEMALLDPRVNESVNIIGIIMQKAFIYENDDDNNNTSFNLTAVCMKCNYQLKHTVPKSTTTAVPCILYTYLSLWFKCNHTTPNQIEYHHNDRRWSQDQDRKRDDKQKKGETAASTAEEEDEDWSQPRWNLEDPGIFIRTSPSLSLYSSRSNNNKPPLPLSVLQMIFKIHGPLALCFPLINVELVDFRQQKLALLIIEVGYGQKLCTGIRLWCWNCNKIIHTLQLQLYQNDIVQLSKNDILTYANIHKCKICQE